MYPHIELYRRYAPNTSKAWTHGRTVQKLYAPSRFGGIKMLPSMSHLLNNVLVVSHGKVPYIVGT